MFMQQYFRGRNSVCPSRFDIIVLLLLSIIITQDPAQILCNAVEQEQNICNRDFNYTKGSTFESNLNTVFNNLVQDTSQSGFNTSVYGQSPYQIYGLLQCRGDATAAQCYNCSQEATTTIRQICGNGVGGRIWFESCYLRYENYSFIGQLSTDGMYLSNPNNVSSPDVFNQALNSLFTKLSAEAASGSKLYASGTTTDSLFRKIYGLVQCWRDLSSDDCTTCLSNTINYILTAYAGRPGARGSMGSCTVRYEIYPFFYSTLPPPPAITPVANSTQSNQSDEKSWKKISIILAVASGLLLLPS